MYYLVNLIKFKNHWKILEKWEKILEKSGKSQGILSVRKSGNPEQVVNKYLSRLKSWFSGTMRAPVQYTKLVITS